METYARLTPRNPVGLQFAHSPRKSAHHRTLTRNHVRLTPPTQRWTPRSSDQRKSPKPVIHCNVSPVAIAPFFSGQPTDPQAKPMKLASVESPAHAVESTSTCAAFACQTCSPLKKPHLAAKREQDVLLLRVRESCGGREERRPRYGRVDTKDPPLLQSSWFNEQRFLLDKFCKVFRDIQTSSAPRRS